MRPLVDPRFTFVFLLWFNVGRFSIFLLKFAHLLEYVLLNNPGYVLSTYTVNFGFPLTYYDYNVLILQVLGTEISEYTMVGFVVVKAIV